MWTAVDPMGQYHHSYSFVGGNPINFIDRWGLEGEENGGGSSDNGDLGHWEGTDRPYYVSNNQSSTPRPPEPAPTGGGSSGPGGGGVVYLTSFGSAGGGDASQRSAQSGQDRTAVRVAHEDELSPPADGRVDVERQETIQKNIMMASLLLGPISTEVRGGAGAISALRAMTGRMPSAARGASQTFKSFSEFKKAMGPAGPGKAWHHIVEQTPGNIAKFGNQSIHTTSNLTKLSHGAGTIHAKVSGYYSSIQPFTNGQTVRSWLSTQSYSQQFEFGIQTMKNFGWVP